MANTKNTIQTIPLSGSLNLNTLKTSVRQFEGFNEKNSTVYGGTLSPMYKKEIDLGYNNISSSNPSYGYTIYNSKGEAYTLGYKNRIFYLVKEGDSKREWELRDLYFYDYNIIESVPVDAVSAFIDSKGHTYYVSSYDIEVDGMNAGWIGADNDDPIVSARIYERGDYVYVFTLGLKTATMFQLNVSNGHIIKHDNTEHTMKIGDTEPVIILGSYTSSREEITVFPKGGDAGALDREGKTFVYKINENKLTSDWTSGSFYVESFAGITPSSTFPIIQGSLYKWVCSYTISQFGGRYLLYERLVNNVPFCYYYITSNDNLTTRYTGHSNERIPSPMSVTRSLYDNVYYDTDGNLIGICLHGMPIESYLNFKRSLINVRDGNYFYQRADGKWIHFYDFILNNYATPPSNLDSYLKKCVIDNRYIIFRRRDGTTAYDIETDTSFSLTNGWMVTDPPYTDTLLNIGYTGCIYGAGYNAGYENSYVDFVGYLPNPYVLTDFPIGAVKYPPIPNHAQYYASFGNTVQSAAYVGTDSNYGGTTYPINITGNVVKPLSLNSEVVNGYSNNDMMKIGNEAYPLIYWNNSRKIYGSYMLSSVENIEGVFSLQGQQYVIDKDNIYAVSYQDGIIQNVQPVTYKKNMTFLGTLPTQAIFYSHYNKTFYSYTGDRILSKMFEASDINKINYVGQNPSTLSIWVCTDSGIYIISDIDMYKLDIITDNVSFVDNKVVFTIKPEDTTKNYNKTEVSLYDISNGAELVPLKLKTAYYGLGNEQKAVMDCWYIRLFDENKTEGDVKVRVNTITDVTKQSEEKVFHVSPSDYDENNIVYLRYQPQYQECTAMQLELESPIGIYELAVGVNATDSAAQISKFNF